MEVAVLLIIVGIPAICHGILIACTRTAKGG